MTEETGEKKPAHGGLRGCVGSAAGHQLNEALTHRAHGGRVCQKGLPKFIWLCPLVLGVLGPFHGFAQARGLDGVAAPEQHVPFIIGDPAQGGGRGPTHVDKSVAHLVGDGVVFIPPVSAEGKAVADEKPNQPSRNRGQKLEKRTLNDALQLLFVQCVISGVVGFLLGYAGFVHWVRRWF